MEGCCSFFEKRLQTDCLSGIKLRIYKTGVRSYNNEAEFFRFVIFIYAGNEQKSELAQVYLIEVLDCDLGGCPGNNSPV